MVVNVGLLVYYKINLQNSVDLAAYYAAAKQAEMLNTMGHINYQIRQSWKLLTFRTAILGTLGPETHPANPYHQPPHPLKPEEPYLANGIRAAPVFCITISNIYGNLMGNGIVNKADNQCKSADERTLGTFDIPQVIFTFPGFNQGLRDGALILQDNFLSEFGLGGTRNFLTLAGFIISFRADSLNRRKVIAVIANDLSADSKDFHDLDNQSVVGGAGKVLTKNLASENNSQLSYELYNSLANSDCGGRAANDETLPGWLKEIDVSALFLYMDSVILTANSNGAVPSEQRLRLMGYAPTDSLPTTVLNLPDTDIKKQKFIEMNTFTGMPGFPSTYPAGRWTTAVGVEKNPWCVPYVGFKATSRPKLPFMPARFTPTLVAKAFAKPFGSRIGPWYGKTWNDKIAGSTSDQNFSAVTDVSLPPRRYDNDTSLPNITKQDHYKYFVNYSRFVGDRLGLGSEGARQAYGKFYWGTEIPPNRYWTNMWTKPFEDALLNNGGFNSNFFLGPRSGDILADAYTDAFFNNIDPAFGLAAAKKFAREMRQSELAAVAPDLFDITYYPIEPRFNRHILPRLKNFVQNRNSKNPNLMVRGDLGWRNPNFGGDGTLAGEEVNVERHVETFSTHPFLTSPPRTQIFQTITDTSLLLTSWAEKSIIDYDKNIAWKKLGTCESKIDRDNQFWVPGGCVRGGRTGYSVKLVSKKFLKRELTDLGGPGASGPILNQPPDDF